MARISVKCNIVYPGTYAWAQLSALDGVSNFFRRVMLLRHNQNEVRALVDLLGRSISIFSVSYHAFMFNYGNNTE